MPTSVAGRACCAAGWACHGLVSRQAPDWDTACRERRLHISTDSLGRPWIATANEGLGASAWWPNKDYLRRRAR